MSWEKLKYNKESTRWIDGAVNDPEAIRSRQSLDQLLTLGILKSSHSKTEHGLKEDINCSMEEIYDSMIGRVILGGR